MLGSHHFFVIVGAASTRYGFSLAPNGGEFVRKPGASGR
jgi:hypothetical protein